MAQPLIRVAVKLNMQMFADSGSQSRGCYALKQGDGFVSWAFTGAGTCSIAKSSQGCLMSQGAGNTVSERGWTQGTSAPAGLCHPGCIRIVKALLGNEARTTARQKTLFCCQGNARKAGWSKSWERRAAALRPRGRRASSSREGERGRKSAAQRVPSPKILIVSVRAVRRQFGFFFFF